MVNGILNATLHELSEESVEPCQRPGYSVLAAFAYLEKRPWPEKALLWMGAPVVGFLG